MYCKGCGKDVHGKDIRSQAVECSGCGVPPLSGNTFCEHCGSTTQANQMLCLTCGTRFPFNP
jgi:hypothetical protein